jgi:hypothetical protein
MIDWMMRRFKEGKWVYIGCHRFHRPREPWGYRRV